MQATPSSPAQGTTPPTPEELLASLKRCSFLLNSSRLVIQDPASRQTAREAVERAQELIDRAEHKRTTREVEVRA